MLQKYMSYKMIISTLLLAGPASVSGLLVCDYCPLGIRGSEMPLYVAIVFLYNNKEHTSWNNVCSLASLIPSGPKITLHLRIQAV